MTPSLSPLHPHQQQQPDRLDSYQKLHLISSLQWRTTTGPQLTSCCSSNQEFLVCGPPPFFEFDPERNSSQHRLNARIEWTRRIEQQPPPLLRVESDAVYTFIKHNNGLASDILASILSSGARMATLCRCVDPFS